LTTTEGFFNVRQRVSCSLGILESGWKKRSSDPLPERPTCFRGLQKKGRCMSANHSYLRTFVFFLIHIYLLSAFLGRGWAADQAGGDPLVAARLQYGGGGDWYNDRSMLPNLMREVEQRTKIETAGEEVIVKLTDAELFQHPFLFMTGHGNVRFDQEEAERLRLYLTSGGFLYVDDDYGMDEAVRRELKKVFPDQELVELPFEHLIYHLLYDFPSGLPKIHEHDNKPPQGFGLFHRGRLVLFYTYETNISDGWADPEVHQDPQEVREQAFRMGINILLYAMLF